MNLNGLIFGILHPIGIPRPRFRDEADRRFLFGEKLAAEVRYRAAGDAG
jgi:hypothetical protein